MSYTQAKQSYETVIKKMQDDLQAYAVLEKANQKAVDLRLDMINKLVAFYQQAEEQISENEMNLFAQHLNWSKLQDSAKKLVYWCKLHGIDPNQPLLYSIEELEEMIIRGRQFRILFQENAIDSFDTVEKIKSKEYEDYLRDDKRYFETLFQCHLHNTRQSGL